MSDPICFTCSPKISLRAACNKWVAVWSFVASTVASFPTPPNFFSAPAREISLCFSISFSKLSLFLISMSFSSAKFSIISTGTLALLKILNISVPVIYPFLDSFSNNFIPPSKAFENFSSSF